MSAIGTSAELARIITGRALVVERTIKDSLEQTKVTGPDLQPFIDDIHIKLDVLLWEIKQLRASLPKRSPRKEESR